MRRCNQTKCSFYLGQTGTCKSCESCKAEPYIINTTCRTCIICEGQEGSLRFDNKSQKKDIEITIKKPKKKEKEIIAEC